MDHGRSRNTGGTGLGLSIVRHVANNHQGRIDVESREGEGSTFTLVLPLKPDRTGRDDAQPAAGRTAPVTVLVAEDEESFVDALVVGLGHEGFKVAVARDGNERTAACSRSRARPRAARPDAARRVSGLDVCRSIRATSSVPIIMVTAKGTEIDTVVALEVGADDYVTKPYRLRELVARIRAVLPPLPGAAGHGPRRTRARRRGRPPWSPARSRSTLDQRRVFVRGEEVQLRRKEFELLRLLVENAGRVLTRDVLIDRVWGSDYIGDTKTLDVHIKRLRSQVEAGPGRADADHDRARRRLSLRRVPG